MFQGNSIETCILSRVKQITSPGWMHETSAWTWCTGKTQRDGVGREVGGGIGMGNTCKSMADSCQCMTKPTKQINKQTNKQNNNNKKEVRHKISCGQVHSLYQEERNILITETDRPPQSGSVQTNLL